MSKSVAFLAGLGTGYMNQKKSQKDEERQAKKDSQDQMIFDANMEKINREKSDRDTLKSAARDVEVDVGAGGMTRPETMDNRDVGMAENQSQPNAGLLPVAARVGTRTFANPDEANKFAQEQNSPTGKSTRIANAYREIGRPEDAIRLETAQSQQKLTGMQVQQAEEQAAREAFNQNAMDEMRQNGTFQGIANILTKTGSNGLNGVSFSAEPSEDGKMMRFVKTDAQGAKTVFREVPNSRDGEMAVMQSIIKAPASQVIEWHRDSIKEAKGDERWNKEFGLKEAASKDKSEYNTAMLDIKRQQVQQAGELAAARIDAANARASAAGQKGLTMEGVQKFNDGLFKSATEYMNPKEAGTPEERQKALEGASRLATVGTNIYMSAFERGIPITQTEALEAAKLAGDNKNLMGIEGKDGQTYSGVMVQGKFIPTGAVVQPSQSKPPQPQQAPSRAPIAAAQGTISPPAQQRVTPARSAYEAAQQNLMRFGLRQRQQDPQGFAKAQSDVAMAEKALSEEKAQINVALDQAKPSFVMARP